ncbi:hypothetical protein [Pseudomonas sp. NPDC086251]|uniref:hypothetical protein n=1 Tax=Pseudomonas sp. NPDC086251 TaxID=3364431 RepID=UPI003838C7F6
MLVYLFDQDNGELLGKSLVHVSEGCGLAPGQTLSVPPRAKKGYAIAQVRGQWQLLEDCRGMTYRTQDGSPVTHLEFGPLPDDLTTVSRPSPHHCWDGNEWVLDAVALAGVEREKAIAQAEAFLKSTDWYIIRQQETGEVIPAPVLSGRKDARDSISAGREQRHV